MQKISNSTSSLLEQLLKTAENTKPQKQQSTLRLADILKTPERKREPTLREILSQAMGETPDAGAAPTPPPMPAIPAAATFAGDAPLGEEDAAGGTCPPEVVQKLVDALIAACGDAEAAKAKIDELGVGTPAAESPLGDEAGAGPVNSVKKGGEAGAEPAAPPPPPPTV